MKNQKSENSALEEIAALKEKFINIKNETEEFVARAKKLSDSGLAEAKELIDSAQSTWNSLTGNLGGLKKFLSTEKASSNSRKKVPKLKKKSQTKTSSKKAKRS